MQRFRLAWMACLPWRCGPRARTASSKPRLSLVLFRACADRCSLAAASASAVEPALEAAQGTNGWFYGFVPLPPDHPATTPAPERVVLMDEHVAGEWRAASLGGGPAPAQLFHGPRTSHAARHGGHKLLLDRMWRASVTGCTRFNVSVQLVPWTCGRGDGVLLAAWHETRLMAVLDIDGGNCAPQFVTLTAKLHAGQRMHVVVDPRDSDYFDGVLLTITADPCSC